MGRLLGFIVLAIISIGWLFWALRRYRTFGEPTVGPLEQAGDGIRS
ncbi:hypothetical protein GA0070607_5269 [Micromonospora coriariae]|uniref:Uncharacterized protein n=1 Tax=Micromonospora coriariae TaxID=285665 RepID=A0A1C4XHL4_9ACTN|nr:hypothetical protein [Micromonospora coriariae]SCF07988.1 hypothetical protein GA0070607_5269 [Micromonospora coriariae]